MATSGTTNTFSNTLAFEFFNKEAYVKSKRETVVDKITFEPTASCYLKVWAREIITYYDRILSDGCDFPSQINEETEYGNEFDFEWEETGKALCYNDTQKPLNDESNLIEETLNWSINPTGTTKNRASQTKLEIKYSILKGYEPVWPSERNPNVDSECLVDSYPRCLNF
jgi:hypothetical protein